MHAQTSQRESDQTARTYDQIRANLIARGALTGPLHWDQLVRECRATATSAEGLVANLEAKAATLPGSHDRIANRDSKRG